MYSSAVAAQPVAASVTRDDVGPQVHVGEARHAAAQHLGDGEFGAVADVLRIDPAALERPHAVAQPGTEAQIFRAAPQQGHGRMGVGVHEPGQQHVVRTLDHLFRRIPCRGLGDRQHGDDAAAADGDRMGLEHADVGLDRNDPAGMDESVYGLHRDRVEGRGPKYTERGFRAGPGVRKRRPPVV
jgi:hypothetical protein